jgi:lycopene beta-cyclase
MNADVIIAGGGLSGGLLALRLALAHPSLRILILERQAALGGNNTWGFQTLGDTEPWLNSVITKTWNSFDVRFPKTDRTVAIRHSVIRSVDFHKGITNHLGDGVRLGCEVRKISDNEVETTNGQFLRAPLVVDATGIHQDQVQKNRFFEAPCAWMKYIGFDLKLNKPHGLKIPVLMDARVPQMDGFRYFSIIPLDDLNLIVQECYLSSNPDLNLQRIKRSIFAYGERNGWSMQSLSQPLVHKEQAAVPLPLQTFPADHILHDAEKIAIEGEDFVNRNPIQVSAAQGWYHSCSGQAVSDAVRVAEFIASRSRLRTGPVRAELRHFRKDWVENQRFYRTFNRLVFQAVEPSLRHVAFDRLMGLKEDVIGRFQAGLSTKADAAKVLGIKPPVRSGKIYKNWASEAPAPEISRAEAQT